MTRCISEADIKAIVEELAKVMPQPQAIPNTCNDCIGPNSKERHSRDHEFIGEVIKLVRHWNEVKWFSIKSVVAVVTLGFVTFLLFYFFGIKIPTKGL